MLQDVYSAAYLMQLLRYDHQLTSPVLQGMWPSRQNRAISLHSERNCRRIVKETANCHHHIWPRPWRWLQTPCPSRYCHHSPHPPFHAVQAVLKLVQSVTRRRRLQPGARRLCSAPIGSISDSHRSASSNVGNARQHPEGRQRLWDVLVAASSSALSSLARWMT